MTEKIELLIKDLQHEDADKRWLAAKALRDIQDKRAIEPLAELILNTADWDEISLESIRALELMDDQRSYYYLLMALDERKENVEGDIGNISRAAAYALNRIGKPVVPLLISVLENPEATVNFKLKATGILSRIGDKRAMPALEKIFSGPDREGLRAAALTALACIGKKDAFEKIRKALTDDDYIIKQYAVSLIAGESAGLLGFDGFKDKRMAPDLIKIIREIESKDMRDLDNEKMVISASKLLGELKEKRAINPLKKLIKDGDNDVRIREAALSAAVAIAGAGIIPELITLIDRNDKSYERLKGAIAKAAIRIGEEVIEEAFGFLEKTDSRYIAVNILQGIGLLSVPHLVRAYREERIPHKLCHLMIEILEPLIRQEKKLHTEEIAGILLETAINGFRKDGEFFRNDNWDTASELLEKIGKPAAKPLEEAVRNDTLPWFIRYEAIKVLRRIGKPALSQLIRLLKDGRWQVRWFAAEMLASFTARRSEAALTSAAEDMDINVRNKSSQSLRIIKRKTEKKRRNPQRGTK